MTKIGSFLPPVAMKKSEVGIPIPLTEIHKPKFRDGQELQNDTAEVTFNTTQPPTRRHLTCVVATVVNFFFQLVLPSTGRRFKRYTVTLKWPWVFSSLERLLNNLSSAFSICSLGLSDDKLKYKRLLSSLTLVSAVINNEVNNVTNYHIIFM